MPRLEPRWDDTAGGNTGKPLESIARVESGRGQEWVIVTQKVTGVWTHFVQARTVPCTGSEITCHIDHRASSQRWQGWVAVQKWNGRRYYWLCLTEATVRDCPALIAENANLRGLQLTVGRSGPGPQSRMWAAIGVGLVDARRLFAAPDARLFLRNLWGNLRQYRKPGCEQEAATDPRDDVIFEAANLIAHNTE